MEDIILKEHNVIYQTYNRLPIVVDYADAAYIYDINNNKYIDFLSGIAVNALGHSHPSILKAIEIQSKKYLHLSNFFYQEPQIKLAELLIQKSKLNKVFFCNSGAETTEAVIKLSRKWGWDKNKTQIIAFSGGFHGRTYGALSLMDKPKYKDKMGPYLENMLIVELNNKEQLIKNVNNNTAAVILEFIQGEGGIREPNFEFVNSILELKKKFNFILIADEVQCGIGRSGDFFAYENWGITPDAITVAKAIGGGLPLGAIIVNEELSEVWQKGNHGTTFGGNALACACGIAVIEELEKGILENVKNVGFYFKKQLIDLQKKYTDLIVDVRGRGLMLGLELSLDAQKVVDLLLDKKIITNATSVNVLRIVPPLIINKDLVDIFIKSLDETLSQINSL